MEALARSPQAAAEYLSGTRDGQPRAGMLGGPAATTPGYGEAPGRAIEAAASVRDRDLRLKVLKALGGVGSTNPAIPDSARDSVARAVAANIGFLKSSQEPDLHGKLPWQAELLAMAQLNGDQSVDHDRRNLVMGAMNGYVANHFPVPGSADYEPQSRDLARFYSLAVVPTAISIYAGEEDGDYLRKGAKGGDAFLSVAGLGAKTPVAGAVVEVVSQGLQALADERANEDRQAGHEEADPAKDRAGAVVRCRGRHVRRDAAPRDPAR